MKNKLLALGLVLALVAVMVIPMAVSAETVPVSGTVPGAPTISSLVSSLTSNDTGNVNTVPTVTINGTGFVTGQTTVSIDGTGISAGAAAVSGDTKLTCTFTIAANAMSGARNVKVTVYGVDSTTLPFSVNVDYTLTVPGSISIPASGSLNLLTNNDSAFQTISFTTNQTGKTYATVNVKDATSTDQGKLKINGTGTALSSALKLSGTGLTTVNALSGSDQTLVDASQGALSGTPLTWSKTTLVITQPAFTTATPGTYSTIITFTATINP